MGLHLANDILDAGGKDEHILLNKAGHYEMIYPASEEWKTVLKVFETIFYE